MKRSSFKAEINVTPLVDVVLVLLIIFMVVTPLLQKARAVELPEVTHVGEKNEREQAFLTVTVEEKIFFGDQELSEDRLDVTLLGTIFVRNVAMVFDAYLRQPREQPAFSRTL